MAEKEKPEPIEKFGITLTRDDMTEGICRAILEIKGKANLKGKQITNVQATIELLEKGIGK